MPYVSARLSYPADSSSHDPESSLEVPIQRKRKDSDRGQNVVFMQRRSAPAPAPVSTTSSTAAGTFDIYDTLFSSDDEDDDDEMFKTDGPGFSKKVKKAMDYSSHHNNLEHSSVSSDQSDSNTRTGAVASRNAIRPSTTTTNQALPTRPVSTNSSNRPTQVDIHSLLYATKWDEATAALSDRPELAAVDKGGDLPLHIALNSNAPLNLIQTLIQAHPRACRAHHLDETRFPLMLAIHWKKTDLTLPTRRERDVLIKTIFHEAPHMGSHLGEAKATVLHAVLEVQPSLDIVKFLVDRVERLPANQKKVLYREKDGQKQLPLHVAIEYHCDDEVICYLLDKYPRAVLVGRIEKLLPLHVALLFGCTARVLQLLLDNQGYKALCSPDEDGNIPLHLWFAEGRVAENLTRREPDDELRHHTILSDEQVFEKIIEKFSLTEVQKLFSTVNDKNRNMVEAANDIQEFVRYPRRILTRMEKIMKSDQYEADTDDEKEFVVID